MAELNNCLLPDDLLYHVEYNVWVRQNDDGTCEVGMTDVAQSLAGSIIHCRPKKVGKKVKLGKSLATVESGKWVGPVKSPVTGEIIEVNEGLASNAQLINRSPYNDGWVVKMKASNLEAEMTELTTGDEAVAAYREKIEQDGVECSHLEGTDSYD